MATITQCCLEKHPTEVESQLRSRAFSKLRDLRGVQHCIHAGKD